MKLKKDLPSKDRTLQKVGAFIFDIVINIMALPFALLIGGKAISPLTDKINATENKEKQDLFNLECVYFLKEIYPDKEFTNVEGYDIYESRHEKEIHIRADYGDMKLNYRVAYNEFKKINNGTI